MRILISTLSLLLFSKRVKSFLLITACIFFVIPVSSFGRAAGSADFLTIDDYNYTRQDFVEWWNYWRESDSVFPATPERFIEWQLLTREALRMELDQEPTFKNKVAVFLKARTLMLLKNEAVDQHLTTTEIELENMYLEKYSPRWQTAVFYFDDIDTAVQACKLLQHKGINIQTTENNLSTLRSELSGLKVNYSNKKLYRPLNIPDNWRDEFVKLKAGEVSTPMAMGEGYVIIYLFSKKTADIKNDSEDYYDRRDTIKQRLIRQKQAKYTDELIRRLIKKYKVELDEGLLADIDIINPQKDLLHKKLITTIKGDVTVTTFLENIKKNQRVRRQNLIDKKAQTSEKWSVVRGIISQSVTTWEALDRHYEDKAPFKLTYQFYRQHRLMKELDRTVFQRDITIQDDDIVAYYHQNIKRFTAKPTISYTQVTASLAKIKKIWAKSLISGNIADNARSEGIVAQQHKGVVQAGVEPDIARILAELNPDELSMPVKTADGAVLIQLLSRQKVGDTLPLAKVYNKIRHELGRQAVRAVKQKFISELKARSTIRLKRRVWQDIREDLVK